MSSTLAAVLGGMVVGGTALWLLTSWGFIPPAPAPFVGAQHPGGFVAGVAVPDGIF